MEDELKSANTLNWVLFSALVISLAIILNTNFRPVKPIQPKVAVVQETKPVEIIKEVEVNKIILINLTNNEKAALFFLIPIFGVGAIIVNGLIKTKSVEKSSKIKFK